MEHLNNVTPNVHDCPSLFITKIILCLLVAAFVVYLPLGEPAQLPKLKQSIINTIPVSRVQSDAALDYICDFYSQVFTKLSQKGLEALSFWTCVAKNTFYDAKLKFYSVLEKFDGDDLCKTVCCPRVTVMWNRIHKETWLSQFRLRKTPLQVIYLAASNDNESFQN